MRLLVISCWWDLSESDGTSTQVTNLLTLFQKIYSEMFFLIPDRSNFVWKNKKIKFNRTYQFKNTFGKFNSYIFLEFNPFFRKMVDFVIKEKKIDTIFLSFPWGVNYILNNYPNIKVLYGANGYERKFALEAVKQLPAIGRYFLSLIIAKIEKRTIEGSNLVISVGDTLTQEILSNFQIPKEKCITIKMGFNFTKEKEKIYDRGQILKKYQLDPDKKYLIFHGGLRHPPNLEAKNLILKKIAPKVWLIDKNVGFVVVGNGNPLFHTQNYYSFPFIDDLDELMSIMYGAIMPIISGSGIRIKAMDYIRNKLPMISTKKGIEGYGFTNNELIITEDQINDDFIQKIIKFTSDPRFANKLAENCIEKVNKELNNEILLQRLKNSFIFN